MTGTRHVVFKQQNTSSSSALAFWFTTRTQHKKRVPIVAEEMSQVLFSIVAGIKGAMSGVEVAIGSAAAISMVAISNGHCIWLSPPLYSC